MTMIRFLSTALCAPALVAAQQGPYAPLTPDQIVSVVASARDRLPWADVHRHDQIFYEALERLLGRRTAALPLARG